MPSVPAALTLLLALLLAPSALAARSPELAGLNQETTRLHEAGRYREALPLAKRARELAEDTYGDEHPDVATSLDSLAVLYLARDDLLHGERLYRRAEAIRERSLETERP